MNINNLTHYFKNPDDKYFIIITCEEDNHGLTYYAEHPEKGMLIAIDWFSFSGELEEIVRHYEGYFYQLFDNKTDEIISYGVVDPLLYEDLEEIDPVLYRDYKVVFA